MLALKTATLSQTIKVKNITNKVIKKNLIYIGINLKRNHKKTIIMVMLNQLTAIKCVSQELLKLDIILSEIFSLVHIRIQARNAHSSFG